MDNDKTMEELKRFLLDIDCLSALKNTSFNIFDVLKISRAEIRHSNVLAWILDPNENHGYSQHFLAKLNTYLARNGLVDNNDMFKLLTMRYSDIVVSREWQNIDILIESADEKYILCIENKIDTQDHSGQLDRYYKIIEDRFSDYTKIYLYLTPDGVAPLQDNNSAWVCVRYEVIVEIITSVLDKFSYDSKSTDFIKAYLEILRRETMGNYEIVKLCQDIYKEHKVALDLIFENRPDRLQNVSEIFKTWCKLKNDEGVLMWDEHKTSKSYIRFRTPFMDQFIKSSNGISGWGTNNHYYYEISSYCDKNDDVKYAMQLEFNATNIEQENKKQIEEIIKILEPKKSLKENWQWKTAFKCPTKTFKSNEILPEDPSEAGGVFKDLDNMFNEIQKIEEKLKKHFN